MLTSQGDYEDIQSSDGSRCRRGSGGIDLSEQFQQAMSVNGGVSDTLIDSEFSQKPANEPRLDTWSEVAGTRSWHTGTATSSSARSNFDPSRYGKPSAGSVSGSVHSFNSSIAERSQTGDDRIEMRNGFAKIKAHVSSLRKYHWELCGSCRWSRAELTSNRNLRILTLGLEMMTGTARPLPQTMMRMMTETVRRP